MAPDHPLTLYNLAVIALAEQRLGDAIAQFELALSARPDYAEAHTNLGVALERSGRAKDAEPHYLAALAARPSHAAAHNNLGRTLLARGDTRGRCRTFERPFAVSPTIPTRSTAWAARCWRRDTPGTLGSSGNAPSRHGPTMSPS